MSPFDVTLLVLNPKKSSELSEKADELYKSLQSNGIDVLLDDRDARPGVKFADAELIGIPHRLVVSDRGLEAGELEYRHRRDEESRNLNREEALNLLKESAIS